MFHKEVSGIIDKRLADIRKKLVRQTPASQTFKFAKKKQPENSLKSKLTQKIKAIEDILNENKQNVKKMKRQS